MFDCCDNRLANHINKLLKSKANEKTYCDGVRLSHRYKR